MKSFNTFLSESYRNYRNKRKSRELGWSSADFSQFDKDPSYKPKEYGALPRFPLNLHKINLNKYKKLIDTAKGELSNTDPFRSTEQIDTDAITQDFPVFPAKSNRRKLRLMQAVEKRFGSLKAAPSDDPLMMAYTRAKNRSRRLGYKFDTDERRIKTLSGFVRDNVPGSTSRIERRQK